MELTRRITPTSTEPKRRAGDGPPFCASGVAAVGQMTFGPAVLDYDEYCSANNFSLSRVEIQGAITSIGAHAFRDCYQLREFLWPRAKITEIPDRCFWADVSLRSVVVPQGVTTFGLFSLGMLWSADEIRLPGTIAAAESNSFLDMGVKVGSLSVIIYAPASGEWGSKWKAYFPSYATAYDAGSNGYSVQAY